ncbi:MAG: glucose-1-phosphate thymidylyltransferase [Candidatus Berkelbacteria bacterium Athens1014_28]|uniref:Glucose-1-phosphate thymidylyltransferase n=1 Tax=Candidatus Berkelbacteria bacterium Athens1014_28 TaxID=2017145 RepID=A0A554LLG0_9BACT|nr:MAG: glucose-1-phosphate thymidylyltransferase [Candidatus Berkelbacteria bacterium Athens1014_28]
MKGIILAGGAGTRLYPATLTVSKQLQAVYDKPMIYYPLSVLMLADIREVLIISTPQDLPNFQRLFGNGDEIGMNFSYAEQAAPNGLAEAFIIGDKFIGRDCVAMILGDNIFHSAGLTGLLQEAKKIKKGGHIFAVHVPDPERFGVVEFNKKGKVLSIEEKPEKPKSSFAVPGLYFFGPEVVKEAKNLKPSARGELEMPDLCRKFLSRGELQVTVLPRGLAWLDTGTHDAMAQAGNYVQIVQEMTNYNIACIEEIAYHKSWIDNKTLDKTIEKMGKSSYADYLKRIERESKNG